MRMMPVSGERAPVSRQRRFRVRWIIVFHYAIAIISLICFAVGWFGTNYFVVADSRGIDRMIQNPVLLTYLFAVVFIFAVVTATGLLRRKLWAKKWSLYTPVVTLPLWVPIVWLMARWTVLGRIGHMSTDPAFEGNVTPVADVWHGAVIALYIWAAASLGYWLVLRKIIRNESVGRGERRTSHKNANLGALGIVLALFLPLIVFRVYDGRMLIHDAADYGWTRTVAMLSHAGQGVNTRTRDGSTPLHYAADSGRLETARYLLKRGANINARNRYGWTPVEWAGEGVYSLWWGYNRDSYEVMLYLLDNGADVERAGEEMVDAVSTIAFCFRKYPYRLVQKLTERGFPVNTEYLGYITMLSIAADYGTPSDVDYLLDHGATMYPGLAAYANQRNMAHLLKRGFDVNERDEDGRTAISWARDNHNYSSSDDGEKVVRLLVKHGASPHTVDGDGTP